MHVRNGARVLLLTLLYLQTWKSATQLLQLGPINNDFHLHVGIDESLLLHLCETIKQGHEFSI